MIYFPFDSCLVNSYCAGQSINRKSLQNYEKWMKCKHSQSTLNNLCILLLKLFVIDLRSPMISYWQEWLMFECEQMCERETEKKASFNCWNFISSFCSLCLFRRHELFILCHRKKCWMIDAKQLKLVKQLLRNIGLSALNWFHFESSVWSTVFFSLRLSFSSIRSSIQILNGNKYWFCSVTLEQFTLLVVYFRWRHSNNKRRQR